MLVLLVTVSYGSLFLPGGVLLLIHLWLDWWLSFLITGALMVAAGAIVNRALMASAHHRAT